MGANIKEIGGRGTLTIEEGSRGRSPSNRK